MAEAGVSGDDLKAKIISQLQATHVEVEDMSGTYIFCPTTPPFPLYTRLPVSLLERIIDRTCRWLRPSILRGHCISTI
jgi:hypothetical protein